MKDRQRRIPLHKLGDQREVTRKAEGALCTVTLHRNSVTVSALAPTTSGPQSDLFARSRVPHHNRAKRGDHVRVR